MMVQRKRNIAGYHDELGRFRPIRTPSFVGAARRPAKPKDKKAYSRQKAGDNEDIFERMARKLRNEGKKEKLILAAIEKEFVGKGASTDGDSRSLAQFVRSHGGIRRTFYHGGKKYRGKVKSHDAGEIDRLSPKESGSRGLTTSNQSRGKTLDGMYQAAREAGYPVANMDDLIERVEREVRAGKSTYATHGYIDYRDNPKGGSKLQVRKITPKAFGVFLRKWCLKKFRSKLAAEKYRDGILGRKRNPSPARIAKAAISVFDNDLDLDVDNKDLRRLQAAMRKLKSKSKRTKSKINPVGWFKDVSPVTAEAVKKLYKKLAARWHPDKPNGDLRTMQEINADYDKAIKVAASNEGNEFRADAERQAAKPLREAIEFAVTLPDDVDVVIRGLWLWIQGNTYPIKDQIKSFVSSDGNRFKFASQKKAWFFAAVPSRNRKGEMSFEDIDALHGRDLIKERKRRLSLNPKRKNPVDPISAFAGIAGGVASALHIKEMLNRPKRRPKRKTNGTTKAQLRKRANNPVAKRKAKFNSGLFREMYLLTVFDRSGRPKVVYLTDGKKAGFDKKFKTAAAAKTYAKKNGIALVENPVKRKLANANPRSKVRKKNIAKVPRRRTFEMFQGRKAEIVKALPVSPHAPRRLDQLGDLVELKVNGRLLKLNPRRFKLCAARGRLWIAGGKFAKENPASLANGLDAIGEIDHVVYATHKPHHGDKPNTHYIHRLGEETGHRPVLAVDKYGYPVIRGGRYKIESRGIVN